MAIHRYRLTIRAILLVMVWLGVCLSAWHVLDGVWFTLWAMVIGLALLITFPRLA
jgi:hypothetical protein